VSLFSWLRDRIGGGPPTIAGFRPAPGPFSEPPAEPVDLDPDHLPWELSGNSGVDDPADPDLDADGH